MHRVENLPVFLSIFTDHGIFMTDDAAGQVIALKAETIDPVVRVDHKPFVRAIIEMIPKEAAQCMLCQLVLAEFADQMIAAVCEHQLSLALAFRDVLHMMNLLAAQRSPDFLYRQIKRMDISRHIVSEILVQPRQSEMHLRPVSANANITPNVGVEKWISLIIIQQSSNVFLSKQKTVGLAMKDVEGGQGNEVRFRRGEFDKNCIFEI